MAKTQAIGHMGCPECGFVDAEIKPQKSGLLYRYCPDCNAQFFARNEDASKRLKAKMRPVTVTEPEADNQGATPEVKPGPGEKKPASRGGGFDMGL